MVRTCNSRRGGYSLLELAVASTVLAVVLGGALGLVTLYRKPADRREKLQGGRVDLAMALETVVRAVRDAESVEEAAGNSLLLRLSSGALDLFEFRAGTDPGKGKLVQVSDALGPVPRLERTLVDGLESCSLTFPPASGPSASAWELTSASASLVAVALSRQVGGEHVSLASGAVCRSRQ